MEKRLRDLASVYSNEHKADRRVGRLFHCLELRRKSGQPHAVVPMTGLLTLKSLLCTEALEAAVYRLLPGASLGSQAFQSPGRSVPSSVHLTQLI